MTKEELYRLNFLYWQSWHGELIESLSYGANHKKQINCANEAINSLKNLKVFLKEEKQKKLDNYIAKLEALKDSITKDTYGNNITFSRSTAEHLRMDILHDFSYQKIKDYLA